MPNAAILLIGWEVNELLEELLGGEVPRGIREGGIGGRRSSLISSFTAFPQPLLVLAPGGVAPKARVALVAEAANANVSPVTE